VRLENACAEACGQDRLKFATRMATDVALCDLNRDESDNRSAAFLSLTCCAQLPGTTKGPCETAPTPRPCARASQTAHFSRSGRSDVRPIPGRSGHHQPPGPADRQRSRIQGSCGRTPWYRSEPACAADPARAKRSRSCARLECAV